MRLLGCVAVLCAVARLVPAEWHCPQLSRRPAAECSCDLPHTLRCAGDHTALQIIGRHLREQKARNKNTAVSLLDLSLRGVSALSGAAVSELAGVGLHGLVISSGDIRRVQQNAFGTVSGTLLALGLPNNQLPSVPTEALNQLKLLDRLDLSNNKIHVLDAGAFKEERNLLTQAAEAYKEVPIDILLEKYFKEGLRNLTYLDMSDNQLTNIAPEAFQPLIKLMVLRLRGNLLKVSALGPLKEARMLKDLDLSSNALEGPLGPLTVPPLSHLTTLQLSDNTFASIRRGCLSGLPSLVTLNLHNNQIDVLEDYAFRHLVNLTNLDLSHNEIVAVSGASLAQLTKLAHLDLSHNFLRSLSAEPLKGLRGLVELLLHDNDISMIDDGALAQHKQLKRLTVEDNPLNCDCLMAGFARWLREANDLSVADKTAAVCATPPHLEGALLCRLSKNKLCDDFEHIDKKNIINKEQSLKGDVENINVIVNTDTATETDLITDTYEEKGLYDDLYDEELDLPSEDDLPISKAKVELNDAWYEDEEIHLSWSLDPPSNYRHRCTGVTVSRAGVIARHVACHRAPPSHVVLRGLKVDPMELYTFCIALEQMDSKDIPAALVLGCSKPTTIRQKATFATIVPTEAAFRVTSAVRLSERNIPAVLAAKPTAPLDAKKLKAAINSEKTAAALMPDIDADLMTSLKSDIVPREALRVSEVRANLTSEGTLTVVISVGDNPPRLPPDGISSPERFINCYVVLAVMTRGSLIAQKDTPCQGTLQITMNGFLRGPYEVCAKLSKYRDDETNPICIVPQYSESAGSLGMKAGIRDLSTVFVTSALVMVAVIVALVWIVRKMMKKPAEFEPHHHICFRQETVPEEVPRTSYVMLTATSKV